jgi:hypothetical protein
MKNKGQAGVSKFSLTMGDVVFATIRLREGEKYKLRPEASEFNGIRCRFFVGHPVNDDDAHPTREAYVGEVSLTPLEGVDWPYGWIASGDVVDISYEP